MRRLADGEASRLAQPSTQFAGHLLVRLRPRLGGLVGRRLVDRPAKQGYGGHLHVVRRERAAVAPDVRPRGAQHPQLGVVDVAADLPVGVPRRSASAASAACTSARNASTSASSTRNLFTTRPAPARPYAAPASDLTMVVISIENHSHANSSRPAPWRSPAALALAAPLLAALRRPRRRRHGTSVVTVVLPAAVRRAAGRGRPRRGHEPDPARRGAARPRARRPADRAGRRRRRRGLRAAGSRPRSTTPSTRATGSTSSTPPQAADLSGDDPHFWLDPQLSRRRRRGRGAARRGRPGPRRGYARNLAGLQPTSPPWTGPSGPGWRTARPHDRGQPRRLRLPRRSATVSTWSAIAGLSPDAEPSPAHLARARRT